MPAQLLARFLLDAHIKACAHRLLLYGSCMPACLQEVLLSRKATRMLPLSQSAGLHLRTCYLPATYCIVPGCLQEELHPA
jgi:hypothetical protein